MRLTLDTRVRRPFVVLAIAVVLLGAMDAPKKPPAHASRVSLQVIYRFGRPVGPPCGPPGRFVSTDPSGRYLGSYAPNSWEEFSLVSSSFPPSDKYCEVDGEFIVALPYVWAYTVRIPRE